MLPVRLSPPDPETNLTQTSNSDLLLICTRVDSSLHDQTDMQAQPAELPMDVLQDQTPLREVRGDASEDRVQEGGGWGRGGWD